MKCNYCNGVGWTAEHDPYCSGECEHFGCPIQVQCEDCNGTGNVKVTEEDFAKAIKEFLAQPSVPYTEEFWKKVAESAAETERKIEEWNKRLEPTDETMRRRFTI